MPHSVVFHVDHANHVDPNGPKGVKALARAFLDHLRESGHDIEEAHVHQHDVGHLDLLKEVEELAQ